MPLAPATRRIPCLPSRNRRAGGARVGRVAEAATGLRLFAGRAGRHPVAPAGPWQKAAEAAARAGSPSLARCWTRVHLCSAEPRLTGAISPGARATAGTVRPAPASTPQHPLLYPSRGRLYPTAATAVHSARPHQPHSSHCCALPTTASNPRQPPLGPHPKPGATTPASAHLGLGRCALRPSRR